MPIYSHISELVQILYSEKKTFFYIQLFSSAWIFNTNVICYSLQEAAQLLEQNTSYQVSFVFRGSSSTYKCSYKKDLWMLYLKCKEIKPL